MTGWPSVCVIVPTRDRPAQVREAVGSVRRQDYPGPLSLIVVDDHAELDPELASLRADQSRPVRVLANARTPGLAGARNTGILAADSDLVAFCDDDDRWLPGKLRAQAGALAARPGAEFASCSIIVRYESSRIPRLAGRDEVTYADLLRSRMVMVHSSTYLAWRQALLGGIGLVDETIPGSQSEDWDLALRAARRRPIVHLDRPLVEVRWGAGSRYAREWETKAQGLLWMLGRHRDIAADRAGAARVYAQLAFARACQGRRAEALRWAGRSLRSDPRERRVPVALAVVAGVTSGDRVLRALHARGHGI